MTYTLNNQVSPAISQNLPVTGNLEIMNHLLALIRVR